MADRLANKDKLSIERFEGGPIRAADSLEESVHQEQVADKLRLVWNQRQFILRVMGAALAVSTLIAFLIPKRYESNTRLMPPEMNSSLAMIAASAGSALAGGAGSAASELLGLKNSADLFVGILESRTVQDDLITKFDLRKVYGDRYWEDARKELSKMTDISLDRKSGIIGIQVTDTNPIRAANMAKEYVAELDQVVTLLNTSSARRERVFLEERLALAKQDLETTERQFSQFASKNTAIDIQEQAKAMIGEGAVVQGQLIAAQTELQSVRQIYAEGNIRVRTLEARIAELQRQLEKIGGNKYGAPADAAKQDDQQLYPSIRQLPLLGVDYADLYRSTKVQEAIFETLTKEYELAKVEEAKETPSIKVIDPANVPERKAYPHRLLIMLTGVFFAFLFAVAWILGQSQWMEMDDRNPHKILVIDVLNDVTAHLPMLSSNGSGSETGNGNYWSRLRNRRALAKESRPSDEPEK
jgi:capsule polysaccharide export protein KpsE/RkpR